MTKNKNYEFLRINLKAFISCDLTSRRLKRNLKRNFAADAADVIMEHLCRMPNDRGSVHYVVRRFFVAAFWNNTGMDGARI